MANPEHLEILKRGVDAWNAWKRENLGKGGFAVAESLHGIRPWLAIERDLRRTPDLRNANLKHLDLMEVDFSYADLRNADLSEADLTSANLSYARLDEADFSRASLNEANLTNAVARNARFSPTALGYVNFTNTDLHGADFGNAIMGGCVFAAIDLGEVRGLESVDHTEPSSIGIDSLYKSKGRIPISFLRGCGLSEDFILYLPSLLNQPVQFYSCFISYSHEDKAFARLLHDRLQGKGIRCWLDAHQLLPGDDLHEGIDRGIRLWDKVLLCCSKSSLTSWWVDGEINRTFQKEQHLMKERGKKVLALIPLNLDGFLFSDDYESGKKAELMSRVAANFVGWEKDHALFDRELEKVVRALRADDDGREKPPVSKI